MAAAAGHETLSEIAPGEALAAGERMPAKEISAWQWLLERMQVDADGVPGSYNDAEMDPWYPYNADGSLNYSDSVGFTLDAVSGNTLTLKTGGADAGKVLLYQRRVANPDYGTGAGVPRWLTESYYGAVKPGMVCQFSGNSKLTYSCWPIITEIVSCVGDTLVVKTDKIATAALSKWEGETGDVTVKVWHQSGNPPKWRHIVKPDYFFGAQRSKYIPEASVPEDGIVELAPGPVKDPTSFDPLHPTWTLEGRRRDNNEWEAVSDQNSRLYIQADASWVALKTEKPSVGTNAPGSDLTSNYSDFRATFWVYVGPDAKSCTVIGYARCVHSFPVSALGYSPPDGMAGGYICLKRRVDVNTPTDSDEDGKIDTMVHTSVPASGVTRFTPLCMQYGCCDQYEAAETSGALYKPFSTRDFRAVQELVGAANQRLLRIIPRVAGFFAWQAQRVAHPSIMWHHGYVALATPNGIDHQVSVFRGMGLWGLGYDTYTDTHGNTFLQLTQGGMDGVKFNSVAEGSGLANLYVDTSGHLLSLPGYNPKRDPVTPGGTVSERELERIGVAVEKDTGTLQYNGGLAQTSVAIAAQNVVIPNVPVDEVTEETTTHRSGGSFVRKPGSGGGVVRLLPLRQAAKPEVSLGTRTVAAVAVDGGAVKIQLANVQHVYSRINDGPEIGDSYDEKFIWDGGGGWPILPVDGHRIDSYYEQHKLAGSRMHGAWSGDAMRVTVGGVTRTFVIKRTEAHGGDAAGSWGEDTHRKWEYTVPAVWRPDRDNLEFTDDDGEKYYGQAVITSVKDTSTMDELTLIESPTRPASIPSGEYWWDGDALYVSEAVSLEVIYTVADPLDTTEPPPLPTAHTEYPVIPAAIEVLTEIPSAEWTDADTQAVLVDGAVPATGYSVDTSDTYVVFTFALADAVKLADITLTWEGVEPPAPLDHYCVTWDYTTFGQKRDVVWVFDDPDGAAAALTAGAEVEFLKIAAVSMPGWTLEWTAYGTDNWAVVDGATVWAGNGEAVIPEAWFEEKEGPVCFRAVGVKLMDHRGIFPASLWEKIRAWMGADKWVMTFMGNARGGEFAYGRFVQQAWYLGQEIDPDTGEPLPTALTNDPPFGFDFAPFQNSLSVKSGCSGIENDWQSVDLQFSSTQLGSPFSLRFIDDDCEILDAVAEVSSSGVTRTVTTVTTDIPNCDGTGWIQEGGTTVDTTLGSIGYIVLGFTSDTAFDIIGSIEGVSPNNTEVINIFPIVQKMWAERATGKYQGYGVIGAPADLVFSGSGADALLPTSDPGWMAFSCPDDPPKSERSYFLQSVSTEIKWGSISVMRVGLLVKPPNGSAYHVLLPSLPPFT